MFSIAAGPLTALERHGLMRSWHASRHAERTFTPNKTAPQLRALKRSVFTFPDSRSLFTYNFERCARPFNTTTLTPTKAHAEDTAHPFHLKVIRRLDTFDPHKFYWRVHVPLEVSKKAAVRRQAMKRAREAFRLELKARGFAWDGTSHHAQQKNLEGALLLISPRDPRRTLTSSYEEIERDMKWILGKVLNAQ